MRKDWKLQDLYPQTFEQNITTESFLPIFYCGRLESNLKTCCFNHNVGLPVKNERDLPIFDYELEIIDILKIKKMLWVKKATGLGITELILRWIIFQALTNPQLKNSQVCIVTAPRLELAISLIDRINKIFPSEDHKATSTTINGVKIEAFPSHHLDTMRGLPNPKIIFLDEADFFPQNMQKEAIAISERYIAKSNPHIILVSTPNMPNGLFDKIEKDKNSLYYKLFLPYTVGLGKIFTESEIENARLSASFEREYNLKYGTNEGNIFPYTLVDDITESYNLALGNNQKILAIDPAYSNSKFAIVGGEKRDGIVYVTHCETIPFASPTAMAENISTLAETYPTVLVDSAGTGLITDLTLKGVDVSKVVFAKSLNDMTINASRMVKEKTVRINPAFNDLIADLKAVRFNEKAHPDKKLIDFDLGDAFLMLCYGFNSVKKTGAFNLGK